MPGTSNFPTALDTFPAIDANTQEDAPGMEHDVVHENVHAAIAAVQQRLGIDESTDPDSFDYKLAQLFASVALKAAQSITINTTAPLAGGGNLSANRTLSIAAATGAAAGSMSAIDKTKLDAITGTNTGDQTSIVGITGTLAQFNTALTGADFASGGGTATGTNTGDQTSIVGITGSLADFNAALTGADFATGGGTVTGASTGTNTGDQTIALTGDVTGSGTGAFVATLSAAAVLSKLLTVDGSGSGLDADSVDGIDSQRIPYGSNSAAISLVSDMNTPTKSGFYERNPGGGVQNSASGLDEWNWFVHVEHSGLNGYGFQLSNIIGTNDLYVRSQNADTWFAWNKIWHNGNDGAGSGLDADFLDGQNGAYYAVDTNVVHTTGPETVGGIKTFANTAVFNGEAQSTFVNSYRHVQGNYGSFWRNDGAALYLMFTASGDQYGSWNSLRPFAVNLVTGRVTMEGGLTINTGAAGIINSLTVQDTGVQGANIQLAGNGATTPDKFIRAQGGNLEFINSAYNSVIATVTDTGALIAASYIQSGAHVTAVQNFISTTGATVLASTGAGDIYLRPNGSGSSVGEFRVNSLGHAVVAATLETGSYTVATLPAGAIGQRTYVTDATAPAYNTALTGGGAVVVPVFKNATIWVSA